MKRLATSLLFLLMGLTLGCAPKTQCLFINSNHQELLDSGYQQKADNLLVIFDGSSSMWDTYNGSRKFHQSKSIILGMNQAISSLKLQAGLHIIGDTTAMTNDSLANDSLIYGMTAYTPSAPMPKIILRRSELFWLRIRRYSSSWKVTPATWAQRDTTAPFHTNGQKASRGIWSKSSTSPLTA